MLPSSPLVTGGVILAGGQVGDAVIWLCQVIHVTPPSENVAMTIGAGLLTAAHLVSRWVSTWIATRNSKGTPANA